MLFEVSSPDIISERARWVGRCQNFVTEPWCTRRDLDIQGLCLGEIENRPLAGKSLRYLGLEIVLTAKAQYGIYFSICETITRERKLGGFG